MNLKKFIKNTAEISKDFQSILGGLKLTVELIKFIVNHLKFYNKDTALS